MIKILTSDITGVIYACKTTKDGKILSKTDVTQQVINAVMKHLDMTDLEYQCIAGDLNFIKAEVKANEKQ